VNVRFACPECDAPSRLELAGAALWQCPACDHRLHAQTVTAELVACPLCGNHELYKKKDFPHWLGLTILTVACLASVFTYGWYEKWLTWAILIGSALFDGLLYLAVGDAVVCYRCGATFRGFKAADLHKPFELTIAERYRQERLRREQFRP
jgi:DNA-directed RNA polymerase subunit RPC12/RpoP